MTEDGVSEEVVPEEVVKEEVVKEAAVKEEVVKEAKETVAVSEKAASTDERNHDKWDKRPRHNGDYDNSDYDRGKRRKRGVGDAVLCRPLEVVVRDDRVEQAIRQLKNRMAREGVLRELKNRRHYFKPSELKRIKSREAARRRRKQARQKNGQ